jgi:hypothetical protein
LRFSGAALSIIWLQLKSEHFRLPREALRYRWHRAAGAAQSILD